MRKELSLGKLLIRFNPLIALSVVLTLALLINLGFWQLGRAEEKRQLQREMVARQIEPPIPLQAIRAEVPSAGSVAETELQALENQNVSATGSYWNEASFVVAFQFFQGAPGFEVITPFQLDGSEDYVLVSRGWVAPGPGDDGMPYVVPIEGTQTLSGQLHVPPVVSGRTQVEGDAWPLRFRRLDIARASEIMERPLLPWVVRLAPGQTGVHARHWPAVTVSTRTNIQYALQWFGMALVVMTITVLMSTNALALLRERRAAPL